MRSRRSPRSRSFSVHPVPCGWDLALSPGLASPLQPSDWEGTQIKSSVSPYKHRGVLPPVPWWAPGGKAVGGPLRGELPGAVWATGPGRL